MRREKRKREREGERERETEIGNDSNRFALHAIA